MCSEAPFLATSHIFLVRSLEDQRTVRFVISLMFSRCLCFRGPLDFANPFNYMYTAFRIGIHKTTGPSGETKGAKLTLFVECCLYCLTMFVLLMCGIVSWIIFYNMTKQKKTRVWSVKSGWAYCHWTFSLAPYSIYSHVYLFIVLYSTMEKTLKQQ